MGLSKCSIRVSQTLLKNAASIMSVMTKASRVLMSPVAKLSATIWVRPGVIQRSLNPCRLMVVWSRAGTQLNAGNSTLISPPSTGSTSISNKSFGLDMAMRVNRSFL